MTGQQGGTAQAGRLTARRPVRGIEVKVDTYAYMSVVAANGEPIPIFDSSGEDGTSTANSNFLIQSVQEGRAEKNQVVETFGDAYIFFFGENPRFIQVQGVLLNSNDFQWRTEWWTNYNTYLRGTKLAEIGARLYLFYDDLIVEGYVMEAQAQENSGSPWQVQFSFKMFVTNHQSVNAAGETAFPVRSTVVLPENVSLTDAHSARALTVKYRGGSFDSAASDQGRYFTNPGGGLLQAAPDGRPRPFAEYKKISDALRATVSSVGYSPDVWNSLAGMPKAQRDELRDMMFRNGMPLRGQIIDNQDEYITNEYNYNPSIKAIAPSALSAQESDDLFQQAINLLGQYGADVNNPSAMNGMGWGPGAPPTYGAQASWSPDTGWQTSTIGPGSNNDPLGAVYGSQTDYNAVSSSRSKYYEGSGDYAYGYASAYASGPGFGQAGFGDYGGGGFGSGVSGGDPGYKDPDKFTSAGVADNRAAYDRFITPKTDDTSITAGGSGVNLGVSGSASASVGASMSFNEAPTAFSITSVEGTLDPSGSLNYNRTFVF